MSAPGQSIIRRLREQDPLLLIGAASLLILVILTAIMLPLFARTIRQRRGLESKLVNLQEAIAQTQRTQATRPAALQQQIADAESQIEALLTNWPTTEQAAQELTRYSQIASELGIQLAHVETLPSDSNQETEPVYRVDRFLIEVRGPMPDLLEFMARVGSHSYATTVLSNITIQPDHPAVGQAVLALYASDLSSGAEPLFSPSPSPTPIAADQQSELLRLEALIKQKLVQGNWAAAIAYGENMLELSPGQGNAKTLLYETHVEWAKALTSQGQLDEARRHYEAALQLVPNGEQAAQGLEGLDTERLLTSIPTVSAGSPTDTPSPETLVYTVLHGDSLSVIANRYGLTVQDLMTTNNLHSTTIYVGQQIVIPLR